jgi:hypothetical protein
MEFRLAARIRINHRKMHDNAWHSFQVLQMVADHHNVKIKIWDAHENIWFDYFAAVDSLTFDANTQTVHFQSHENGHWAERQIRFESPQDYQAFLDDFATIAKQASQASGQPRAHD